MKVSSKSAISRSILLANRSGSEVMNCTNRPDCDANVAAHADSQSTAACPPVVSRGRDAIWRLGNEPALCFGPGVLFQRPVVDFADDGNVGASARTRLGLRDHQLTV